MVAGFPEQEARRVKAPLPRNRMSRGNGAAMAIPVVRPEQIGRRALLGALSIVAPMMVSAHVMAADPGTLQQVDGLAIYFAVVPAAFVLGHPAEHTGREMHGGVLDDRYTHHLVLVVFDATTGVRITDARVTAVVRSGLHPPQGPIDLGPMTLAGAQAYGGFAALPPRDRYLIEIEVARPGAAIVRAVFSHQHLQPQP